VVGFREFHHFFEGVCHHPKRNTFFINGGGLPRERSIQNKHVSLWDPYFESINTYIGGIFFLTFSFVKFQRFGGANQIVVSIRLLVPLIKAPQVVV